MSLQAAMPRSQLLLKDFADALEALGVAECLAHSSAPISQLDQCAEAGKAVLSFHASLPRHVAIRTISDENVRAILEVALEAEKQCRLLGQPLAQAQLDRKFKNVDILIQMWDLNEQRAAPLDLTKMVDRSRQDLAGTIGYWDHAVIRDERRLSTLSSALALPAVFIKARQAQITQKRHYVGSFLFSKFMQLEALVDRANFDKFVNESGHRKITRQERVKNDTQNRLLVSFEEDIYPAFKSVLDSVGASNGQPLDEEILTILDGSVGRLAEFALNLDKTVTQMHKVDQTEDIKTSEASINKVVECAWTVADAITRTIASSREAVAALMAAEDSTLGPKQSHAPSVQTKRKKVRGKHTKPAGSRATAPATERARIGQKVGRSKLGTQMLVAADPVKTRATPAQTGQAAKSDLSLRQPLAHLNELVNFDLPEQQKIVSRARHDLAPENAAYVVETTVQGLKAQAINMQDCLDALENSTERLALSPAELIKVHAQTEQLGTLLSQTRGLAKSLKENLPAATLDHMKTYPLPTQSHIEQLRQAGQLAASAAPRALKGEPGTLFEVGLQPSALSNGTLPPPIWLHIHTAEPVCADQLPSLDDALIAASHVKSDHERGYNREWQNAQAAAGHHNVTIYRGKITPRLCRTLVAG